MALKPTLKSIVSSEEFEGYISKKAATFKEKSEVAVGLVGTREFWTSAKEFLTIMTPIRVFLRYTDQTDSLACKVT